MIEQEETLLLLKVTKDDIAKIFSCNLLKPLDDAGINYKFQLSDYKSIKNNQVKIRI